MIQAGIASSLSWGCDEEGQVEYSKRLGKLGRVLQLFIDFFLPCHLRSLAAYSFIFLHLKLLKLERDYISISWNKLFSIIFISPDIFEVKGFCTYLFHFLKYTYGRQFLTSIQWFMALLAYTRRVQTLAIHVLILCALFWFLLTLLLPFSSQWSLWWRYQGLLP